MVLQVLESTLSCHRCNAETSHELTYIGDHLAEAVCLRCRAASGLTGRRLLATYVGESVERALGWPARLRREFLEDFPLTTITLPWRLASAPFRLAREGMQLYRCHTEIAAARRSQSRPDGRG
jgi:hypothetical protein